MTVYVDDTRAHFGHLLLCHMTADTEVELHAMAQRSDLSRRWYQGDHWSHGHHYYIPLRNRALAIAAGAVLIDCHTYARMVRHRLRFGVLPTPEEAVAMEDAAGMIKFTSQMVSHE